MGKVGGIENWDCEVCWRFRECLHEGYERVGGQGPNNERQRLIDLIDMIRRSGNVRAWTNDRNIMYVLDSIKCTLNGWKADSDMPVCCLHRDHRTSRFPSRNEGLPCYGCYNFQGRGSEEGSARADIHDALRADGHESEKEEGGKGEEDRKRRRTCDGRRGRWMMRSRHVSGKGSGVSNRRSAEISDRAEEGRDFAPRT
jgi:hypothetical protein